MKVSLKIHGGQGAAIYLGRPPRIVDSDALSEKDATELTRLVAKAAATSSSSSASGKARDAMSYTIEVLDDGKQTTLSQSDVTMSQAFADLLAWLQTH